MTTSLQGSYQAAGLCVALIFGIGGGIIVGKSVPPNVFCPLFWFVSVLKSDLRRS